VTVIVEAAGLRKAYGGQQVLDGVDLAAAEGTVLALLGPNGAGKTTTVRILSTLTRPDGGAATIAGHDVVRDPVGVRGVISLTGQYAALDDRQTGRRTWSCSAGWPTWTGRPPAAGRTTCSSGSTWPGTPIAGSVSGPAACGAGWTWR
jgi:ABC-2 type transport system ATP-binding protein